MDAKNKILVAGDVEGKFKQLFSRVETINKKSGPFDLLLCVGNVFGQSNVELEAYKNNAKLIPVPTVILGPNRDSDALQYAGYENEDICSNLTYLGKRGLYTLSSGLKVAYIGGVESAESTDYTFNKADVISVMNSCIVAKTTMSDYRGVDILITSQWPAGIQDEEPENTSKLIAWLANEIKPRYHFCGLNGVYYERLPYRNTVSANTQMELATRFISLAKVGNAEKSKYIYALNIMPVEKMRILELIQKTTDETKCPYTSTLFDQQLGGSQDKSAQYFYDMDGGDENQHGKRRRMGGRPPRKNFDQEKCWFCLSSQNVEKHLVISIGENFYIALAKGPLNEEHVLLLPITHIQCAAMLSVDDWNELEKFKSALRQYFKSQNKVVCFFERNYKSSHLQMNAVAVDADMEWQFKHAFDDKSEEYNLSMETMPKLTEATQLPESGAYFYAELPDGTTMLTRQMKHFPIHFGREILCHENLLNCCDKIDWKECSLDKDEEIELVKNFRENYKEFDFTL